MEHSHCFRASKHPNLSLHRCLVHHSLHFHQVQPPQRQELSQDPHSPSPYQPNRTNQNHPIQIFVPIVISSHIHIHHGNRQHPFTVRHLPCPSSLLLFSPSLALSGRRLLLATSMSFSIKAFSNLSIQCASTSLCRNSRSSHSAKGPNTPFRTRFAKCVPFPTRWGFGWGGGRKGVRSRRCLLCSHCLDGVVGRDDPFGTGTAGCVSRGF